MTKENNAEEKDDAVSGADKAVAIGKEIGVENTLNQDEGDEYEIIEEADEKLDKRSTEKVDSHAEKKEREKLSNRDKRLLRKKKINEKFSEKDAEIARLAHENEEMRRWKSEVDGRLHGINRGEVEKAINDTANIFNQAERDHATAFTEGDGTKATQAMRVMYDAQRRLEQLGGLKQQLDKAPAQEVQTRESAPTDRKISDKRREWEERNDWYDAESGDTDSEVAKTLAGILVKEKFDPRTDDFWDELDDRLAKYMPDKISAADDEEEDEPLERTPKVKKRAAPPVGGNGSRGDLAGKKTIKLKTSFINGLKESGLWDDPKARQRAINRHLEIQKESGR